MKIVLQIALLVLSIASCAQNADKKETGATNKLNMDTMNLTEQEWKEKLSPEQYYILRQKGTEKPFSGEFVFTKDKGTYKCAGCGEALFTDDMKFDAHCGWPSFDKEIEGGKIKQTIDKSHGMIRTEITCAKCGGHLGHIFDDGPTETGQRYCVNSVALSFEPADKSAEKASTETITLGGGCFWCIEAVFDELKGVTNVESGYSGGKTENPTYKDVTSGYTGHAEVVQVTYNPAEISLEEILEVFFTVHDPTTLNRQGADVGTQYRSAIFYHNDGQKEIIDRVLTTLVENKVFDKKIVTQVEPFGAFYIAENYHQEYYQLNQEQPYCRAVIKPKMDKLHKVFADKLKSASN